MTREHRAVWTREGILAIQVGHVSPEADERTVWLAMEARGWLVSWSVERGSWRTQRSGVRMVGVIRAEHTHWVVMDWATLAGVLMPRGAGWPLDPLAELAQVPDVVALRQVPDRRALGDEVWVPRVRELLASAGWEVCPGRISGRGDRVAIPIRRAG